MAKHEKLLLRVRNNPRNVRYSDMLTLVDAFGFRFLRQEGSHRQYLHPTANLYLNLQPDEGSKAKPYQVRWLLKQIDAHGLRLGEE